MIWAVILILAGILMLTNHLLGFGLPVAKILFGIFLVWLGLKILIGSFTLSTDVKKLQTDNNAVFSENQFKYPNAKNSREFNVVFGQGKINLAGIDLRQGSVEISLNSVLGTFEVFVDPVTPIRIETNVLLGKASLPDGSQTMMGKGTFELAGSGLNLQGNQQRSRLTIKINSVGGQVLIKYH